MTVDVLEAIRWQERKEERRERMNVKSRRKDRGERGISAGVTTSR